MSKKNNRPAIQENFRFKVQVKTKTGIYDVETIDTSELNIRKYYSEMNSSKEPLEVLDVSLLNGAETN